MVVLPKILQQTLILFGIILATCAQSYAQNPQEILRKSEEKRRGINSSQAEMTMTIIRPEWSREMKMKSWSQGEDFALILVTAPARDKGTANLKRKKEVWSWVPRIERTIKLPPSMMSQSWMGSDLKNEDLVQEYSLISDYDHRMLDPETIEGRLCHQIELIPHEDAAVVWGKIIMWIDQKDLLQLKTEFYDEDDYHINTMRATEIKELGGRILPTRMEIVPQEEEGHKTVLEYHDIVFDKNLPAAFFTVQNMKRVR